MQRKYKLFLQTDNFIEETITITIITVVTTAAPYTTITNKDYITSYIIKKDITHKNILGRSKKSLKLNLELPTKTDLANLITNSRNNLTNIL
jgi:hypothetical protein